MLRAARSALVARQPPIASRRPTIARAAASSPAMGAPPAPPTPSPAASARAADLLSFIDASWTQYHAVAVAASRLDAAGFARIHETDAWALRAGGRYYFTRGGSTLVAFAVGGGYKAGNGFHVVGAHTDSPCLKLKPVSAGARAGYAMVNVEPYGGGLWSTWFDRDLTVAGRVLVKGGDGKITARLVAVDRPLLRVPMLAIHLQRELADKGFAPNKQAHVVPVLASRVAAVANEGGGGGALPTPKHHPALLAAVADAAGVPVESIVDFDLNVCDTQRGAIGGAYNEFVFVGRLDNLAMTYVAVTALIDAFGTGAGDALDKEPAVAAVALFDHEEVGSASAQGAGGPVMRDAVFRIARALAGPDAEGAVVRALQASFLVSADMAHAVREEGGEERDVEDPNRRTPSQTSTLFFRRSTPTTPTGTTPTTAPSLAVASSSSTTPTNATRRTRRPPPSSARSARGTASRRKSFACAPTSRAGRPSAPSSRPAWAWPPSTWARPSCRCTPFGRWPA